MSGSYINSLKNKHKGQECILFGSGPSLKSFDTNFAEGKILLGSNEIVYYDLIMDYYMIGDGGTKSRGYYSDPDTYNTYKPNVTKFCRQPPKNRRSSYQPLPENIDTFTYFETDREAWDSDSPFNVNQINDVGTISLELAQFCLILGFSTIYLVGQDCNYNNGSFKSSVTSDIINWSNRMIPMWIKFKEFISDHHPDVNIISINPVGLANIFDKY